MNLLAALPSPAPTLPLLIAVADERAQRRFLGSGQEQFKILR